ncbi:MAG: hypothetical protein HN522_06145 [Flavobacteriales bacterium]|jgi:hypothetical protein|nr:hypothetical protein [Flavobacteriales bacterium]MBT5750117.1 hypothetical protein [Flavobacteriales bacterium]
MKRILLILLFSPVIIFAQDELIQLLNDDSNYKISSTFKGVKIVNSQSAELVSKGDLLFLIQHRFGPLNSGAYNLYGLDNAQVRFGLDYGLNDWFSIGMGRSSFLKTIDANTKIKLLSQSKGKDFFPFSIVWYSSVFFKQSIWKEMQGLDYLFSDQISYVHQLLVARKITSAFSLQLSPTLVHKNIVNQGEANDLLSVGLGARHKLTSKFSLNVEYFLQLNKENSINPLSLGVDIETGGHVFQLHLSNSAAMFERAFIHETNGNWSNGDIYFGFNISRVFTLKE